MLAGVLLSLVALLAGCGATAQVGSDRTLQVALTEYHVAPQRVRAPSGPLAILVHNYGRLTHNLVISTGGQSEASTAPIPPGQTTELIATLPPGRYLLASTILSDEALGAYGTLIVTGSPRVAPGHLCFSFSPGNPCPRQEPPSRRRTSVHPRRRL
jgi:Cupredoxin-like domain